MKTRHYLPAIVIGSATLLLLWKLVFTDLILGRGDTFFYFYPYWEHRARALLDGQFPLWNPYLFMGAPFLANPQAGVLYPLNWPLAPFPVTTAVKIAIITHVFLAAAGAFKLARHGLNLNASAATVTALLFALGGHISGKVEQVNQLQSLAWLPWLLLASHRLVSGSSTRKRSRAGLAFSGFLAMQFLAGHTQTTFISLVAVVLWAVTSLLVANKHMSRFSTMLRLFQLIPFMIIGLLIAGAQLFPTFELASKSLRSTGLQLSDALSFSMHPLLLGRALLPGFSRPLFTEFVGYIGISGLLLTFAGIATLSHNATERPRYLPAVLLSCLGIFLALGAYNPIYWPLAKFVPGFDLFRAPARWLAIWALAAALLAGLGFERVSLLPEYLRRRLALAVTASTIILVALAFASTGLTPPGETGPLPTPSTLDISAWALALFCTLAALFIPIARPHLLLFTLAIEIGLASLQLPLNNLTTADAYTSVRAPMTPLLLHRDDLPVPDRIFSMSSLYFDPGDLDDIRTNLRVQLPEPAVTTAVDAAKAKEVFSPNLPLSWRIPSVDGYDGGVLPLRAYAQFAKQFTRDGVLVEDGRLRELVIDTPANWVLNITNTRWLLNDKLDDVWRNDVFYDLQFQITLPLGASTELAVQPTFHATEVGLVLSAPEVENDPLGHLHLDLADGSTQIVPIPAKLASSGGHIPLVEPMALTAVRLQSAMDGLQLRGAAVIDSRSGAFITLTIGPYHMEHSGDVKLYENLNVFPRAYLVSDLPLSAETQPIGHTLIHTYTPNRVVVETESDIAGTLVLADAYYPGWRATIDGNITDILPANSFFRAVTVPSGKHEVVFDYRPLSLCWGLWTSMLTLLLWTTCQLLTRRRAHLSD